MKLAAIVVVSALLAACGSGPQLYDQPPTLPPLPDGGGDVVNEAGDGGAGEADAAQRDAGPCDPWDAVGVGDACSTILGYKWAGRGCAAVIGCDCVGADCGHLYTGLDPFGLCVYDHTLTWRCPSGPADGGRE